MGLPRRSTSAVWMLGFLIPADVSRNFTGFSPCDGLTLLDDHDPDVAVADDDLLFLQGKDGLEGGFRKDQVLFAHACSPPSEWYLSGTPQSFQAVGTPPFRQLTVPNTFSEWSRDEGAESINGCSHWSTGRHQESQSG